MSTEDQPKYHDVARIHGVRGYVFRVLDAYLPNTRPAGHQAGGDCTRLPTHIRGGVVYYSRDQAHVWWVGDRAVSFFGCVEAMVAQHPDIDWVKVPSCSFISGKEDPLCAVVGLDVSSGQMVAPASVYVSRADVVTDHDGDCIAMLDVSDDEVWFELVPSTWPALMDLRRTGALVLGYDGQSSFSFKVTRALASHEWARLGYSLGPDCSSGTAAYRVRPSCFGGGLRLGKMHGDFYGRAHESQLLLADSTTSDLVLDTNRTSLVVNTAYFAGRDTPLSLLAGVADRVHVHTDYRCWSRNPIEIMPEDMGRLRLVNDTELMWRTGKPIRMDAASITSMPHGVVMGVTAEQPGGAAIVNDSALFESFYVESGIARRKYAVPSGAESTRVYVLSDNKPHIREAFHINFLSTLPSRGTANHRTRLANASVKDQIVAAAGRLPTGYHPKTVTLEEAVRTVQVEDAIRAGSLVAAGVFARKLMTLWGCPTADSRAQPAVTERVIAVAKREGILRVADCGQDQGKYLPAETDTLEFFALAPGFLLDGIHSGAGLLIKTFVADENLRSAVALGALKGSDSGFNDF